MNSSLHILRIDDFGQIIEILKELTARIPKRNGAESSTAVLIGSRAAIHYDSKIRQWENPTIDSDWDFILPVSRAFEFMITQVGAKFSRLTAISAISFPGDASQIFRNQSHHFLEINLTIVLESGETLEFELVDFSLSVIQSRSAAKLMDLVSTKNNLIDRKTPIGSSIVAPLEILISLKESHSILKPNWRKTISDLERLREISDPTARSIDSDRVEEFLALRNEESSRRSDSSLSADQWSLLTNLRRLVGPRLDIDGSVCVLSKESTYEQLSLEDKIEYIKLEGTIHLLMFQNVKSPLDVSDEMILRAQELFATSENYCKPARYFFVSQRMQMLQWMQAYLPSISSSCMAALKDAIDMTKRSESHQNTMLSNASSSTKPVSRHADENSYFPSLGELPGDVLLEILSFVSSSSEVGRLCLSSTHSSKLLSSSSFWRRLSLLSFPAFVSDASSLGGQNSPSESSKFDWKSFHIAFTRTVDTPRPDMTALSSKNLISKMGRLLRTPTPAASFAFDSTGDEELAFLARWATIAAESTEEESTKTDNPAWIHYQVDLTVKFPNLRILTFCMKVSEDFREYVKGDSKAWDEADGRPRMNCELRILDENLEPYENQLLDLEFSEKDAIIRWKPNWSQLGLKSELLTRPEFWSAMLISLCPESDRIFGTF